MSVKIESKCGINFDIFTKVLWLTQWGSSVCTSDRVLALGQLWPLSSASNMRFVHLKLYCYTLMPSVSREWPVSHLHGSKRKVWKKNLSSTFWCEIWCYSFKCFAASNPVIQSDLKLFKDLELIVDNSYLTTEFWSSVCGSKLISGHCYINFLCPIELQSEVTLPQSSASSVFQIQRSSPGVTNKINEELRREPSGDARSCAFIHNNCAVSISSWLNKGNSLFLPLQRWYVPFCSDFKEQKQAFQAAVIAPTVQPLY